MYSKRGGGEGIWDPKLCEPKMAQQDFPASLVFSHDGHLGRGGSPHMVVSRSNTSRGGGGGFHEGWSAAGRAVQAVPSAISRSGLRRGGGGQPLWHVLPWGMLPWDHPQWISRSTVVFDIAKDCKRKKKPGIRHTEQLIATFAAMDLLLVGVPCMDWLIPPGPTK